MATLSAVQVAALLHEGGVPDNALATWVAISRAESGYRTDAEGGGAIGLMQIQISAHPEYSVTQMQDPKANVEAAKKISNNWTNTSPWSAHNNGSSMQFMPEATQAAAEVLHKSPEEIKALTASLGQGGAATGSGGGGSAIAALFKAATWKRIGMVLGGSVLMLMAVMRFFPAIGNTVSGAAKTAVKVAMVVK